MAALRMVLARNLMRRLRTERVRRAVNIPLSYESTDALRHEMQERKVFLRDCFHYLSFNGISGDYAEFGCNGANTFRLAFSSSRLFSYKTHLWGFDSFAGLPGPSDARDDHPQWIAGAMATSQREFRVLCDAHTMTPQDYTLVPGYYADSLRDGLPALTKVALAYIDCDLYSSTREALIFLMPRLQHGSIVAFDDYFCCSESAPSGERDAMLEVFGEGDHWALIPYHTFGWHGMSFILEARAGRRPSLVYEDSALQTK